MTSDSTANSQYRTLVFRMWPTEGETAKRIATGLLAICKLRGPDHISLITDEAFKSATRVNEDFVTAAKEMGLTSNEYVEASFFAHTFLPRLCGGDLAREEPDDIIHDLVKAHLLPQSKSADFRRALDYWKSRQTDLTSRIDKIEAEWASVYGLLTSRFNWRNILRKHKRQKAILDLANHVKDHPQFHLSMESGARIGVPAFKYLLREPKGDIVPYLADHRSTLISMNNELDSRSPSQIFSKWGGIGAILWGGWRALCYLVLQPYLGIQCVEIGPDSAGFAGSAVIWIAAGLVILLLTTVSEKAGRFVPSSK